jgi:uncharacterized membrane protein
MLRDTLLTVHILSIIVWLGGGLYDFFVSHEIKKAHERPEGVVLTRLYLKYIGPVAAGTILVLITGVWMSLALGHGFFQTLWLGTKQGLMLVALATIPILVPLFRQLGDAMDALPDDASALSSEAVTALRRIDPPMIVARSAGAIAVVLAVWRPM